MAATKTMCPITRGEFSADAPNAITAVVAGNNTVLLGKKVFSTNSLGYYANGKITLEIAGKPVVFQLGFQLTAVGSKELPA